jgi:uncharacterized membrane protein YdjX (TVP38/TMEM64 family)
MRLSYIDVIALVALLALVLLSIWPSQIDFLIGLMMDIMKSLSLPGLFVVMILQSVISPIPAEALLFVAAGTFGWYQAFLVGLAGMMVGAAVNYLISLKAGRPIVERLTDPETISKLQVYVDKYGAPSVLILRLIPVISFDAVSYLAGLAKIPFVQFIVLTFIGLLFRVFLFTRFGEVFFGSIGTGSLQLLSVCLAVFVLVFLLSKPASKLLRRRNRGNDQAIPRGNLSNQP